MLRNLEIESSRKPDFKKYNIQSFEESRNQAQEIQISRTLISKVVPAIQSFAIYAFIIWSAIHSFIDWFVEYGHEAKPSILGLQIVFLAARRDDDYDDYYRARQEI